MGYHDYHVEEPPRPKLKWLRVRDAAGLERIRGWLKSLKGEVNTYTGPKTDKRGDWIITLGWDRRPDSDWGRYDGHRAAIWFGSEDLAREGDRLLEKHWGVLR